MLGEELRCAKKLEESAAVLREFMAMDASHPLADGAYLSLGETLEAQGKSAEALDIYQQIISQFSDRYSAPVAQMAQGEYSSHPREDRGSPVAPMRTYRRNFPKASLRGKPWKRRSC